MARIFLSDRLRCGLWLREEQFSTSNSSLIYKDDQSKRNNLWHKYYIQIFKSDLPFTTYSRLRWEFVTKDS